MAALASSSVGAEAVDLVEEGVGGLAHGLRQLRKAVGDVLGKVVHALGELGHVIAEGVERVGQVHAQLFADALAVALQHGAGGANLAGGFQKARGALAADLAEALQKVLLRLLQILHGAAELRVHGGDAL